MWKTIFFYFYTMFFPMYFYFWLIFWKKKKTLVHHLRMGSKVCKKSAFWEPILWWRTDVPFWNIKKNIKKKVRLALAPYDPPCLRPWSQPISQIMYFLFSVTFKLKFCMKSFVVFWSILTELTDYVFLTICYILTKIF